MSFVKGLTGNRDIDVTSIAKAVAENVNDYARIVAPEWPGTMEYSPQQISDYVGRDPSGQNKNMVEQLSEFGAWRDQVMGVEVRNGGNIRILLDCLATCDRLKLPGQKEVEQLVSEQYAPDRYRRRWEGNGIVRPFVWQELVDRQRKADFMKVEFELLPAWLRGTRARTTAPKRQRRETRPPERLGGFYEPDDEDVL